MKLSTTRLASLILARFARALVAADVPPGLVVKTCVGETVSMMLRAVSKRTLRRFAERTLWPRFDFRQMTRLAAGEVWHDANRRQQRALEDGFRDLLLSRYAASLSSAANSRLQFEIKPVPHSIANDVTVKTLITRTANPTIAIDFRLENQRNGWKVYDVLVDRVSVTTTCRDLFLDNVRRSGICGSIKVPRATDRSLAIARDSQSRAFA